MLLFKFEYKRGVLLGALGSEIFFSLNLIVTLEIVEWNFLASGQLNSRYLRGWLV